MTHQLTEHSVIDQIIETLAEEGLGCADQALTILLNAAMRLERERHLGAKNYERTEERRGYANGYKPKTVKSRVGELKLSVPQVRDGSFYPNSLDKGLRSERALKVSLAEMYVQGVSTRKVAQITEQLCGTHVSTAEVSRAAAELDETLSAFRNRPLGNVPFVSLDARYENVRYEGSVRRCAVLIARGVQQDGRRSILGVSVSLSEAEVHWREFLSSLHKRGLHGIRLITSDDHAGLRAAREAVFAGFPWQRCQLSSSAKCARLRHQQSYSERVRLQDTRHIQCARPI